MNLDLNWFQLAPIPPNAMSGVYDLKLVVLSYIIAVLASYVALDLVGRLRAEISAQAKLYWLVGGAFAMGAGIWSMHFIGMLAFIMPMAMSYSLFWTASSLLVAILASALALYILRDPGRRPIYMITGGILIGLGIASMHYMGMEGMTYSVQIHYLPSLFFLSIAIAILASEAALWLALQSNQGTANRQFYLKVVSALIMGVAICGMHYTGMYAAVFTPLLKPTLGVEVIAPTLLAFFIAGITGLIISLALMVSTYYKRMIAAVQNEKEFLNIMLDNLEDEIIACDATGKITVFNDVFQKKGLMTSKKEDIKELSDYFDFYPPDKNTPLPKGEIPLDQVLNGERIHGKEYVIKFKNNRTREVVVDGQAIINTYGDKVGAVIAIHDVTEIKKTEKIKSEFVSVVSHELRTPLTSIRGSLGLLLGGTLEEFSDKTKKLLTIANKNCDRLLILINDILDMEKIQAGKMKFELKVVDIDALTKEAININKSYGDEYNINFVLNNSLSDTDVYVDPDRLLQVLANLLSNAAKFSPTGTTVALDITKYDKYVRVSVTDKGPGIPLEFQPRIFQKFSQADSSDTRGKGGTGLGLSISKAIIEKFGGSLNFISELKHGTTFYFDLPIYQSNAIPLPTTKPTTTVAKLLICEDDEDQAKYLNILLEGAGLYSDIANTVSQAKKLLAKNKYRAILLDLILPDEDGISFIRELRHSEKTRELPIIVLSVITDAGRELLNGDAMLVVDWLDKPVNVDKLLSAIARIKMNKIGGLPNILHIEDDIDTQHLVKTLLEKEASVTTAGNIHDAVLHIGKDNYDLVILDLLLPDGNGADLLPIFSKYKLPIIVYSAFELDKEHAKYVSESLVKSQISNEELLGTIKNLLNHTAKDNEYVE